MTDDRDRVRAEEWTWARGIVHRELTDSLVSLLSQARSEARAEGAVEAIDAAAGLVERRISEYAIGEFRDEIERMATLMMERGDLFRRFAEAECESVQDALREVARAIRALSPAGLVAVSRADLELVLPLAPGGPADYQQPSEWRDAHRRLRDVVARVAGRQG